MKQHPEQIAAFAPLKTFDGRGAGWHWGERPRCISAAPTEHRLGIPKQKRPVLTETIITCEFRIDRGAPVCGTQQYIRRIPRMTKHSPHEWFSCEVTVDHIRRLSQEPMTFLETMTILGCVLPGVEFDLPRCRRCGKSIARHAAAAHEFEAEEG